MRSSTRPVHPRRRDGERGMSLVVTMLILMFLLALGMAVVWYTSLQMGAARNLNARQMAANAAQAGVQHVRAILAPTTTDWSQCLAGHTNTANSIPDASNPTRIGAILYKDCANGSGTDCTTGTGPLQNCPFTAASGDAGLQSLGTYTVWIRNDPADLARASWTTDTNTAVIVRVVGSDPAGTAQVVLEAAVVRDTGPGVNRDVFIYGKNIDASNSSSARGAVRFQ